VRYLIVGCGCRGLALARVLTDAGHVVRGTTRDPDRVPVLAAAGVEPVVADPDRVGTLVPSLERVGAVCLLLGSADSEVLHGPRLEMLLTKLIDTTVHGVVYESAGSARAELLARGAELVRTACERSHISYSVLQGDAADHAAWLAEAADAAETISR